ncbi:type IV toxin-antitoxin system AbiEi family antitoxin domain-containing protein [Microbacterium sp. NPDC096154]|uniref:type IV toxin-antitoxin system AbiEi family antitoxin domain-containing protein n=1 Tax=Microbacterium sp. NPDC096154 TaxID=3155549 RepID=UPI0033272C9B
MDLSAALTQADGVARVRALYELGIGDHAIRKAVAAGEVVRVRRGWIARRDADPLLVTAAAVGVVLTCVTQAQRLGLWTVTHDVHVAAPPHGNLARPTAAHVHWNTPLIPRGPDALVDPIENVLALVAQCRPHEEALAVWESALRLGMLDRDVMRRLPLGPDARGLLAEAQPFADQGTETVIMSRLRWLKLPMQRQVVLAGRPVDLLIGERLVIQVDGGHHVDAQRLADNEHDARLRLMGYHVIRVGYWQLFDDWATVQGLITRAIAQRLHLA